MDRDPSTAGDKAPADRVMSVSAQAPEGVTRRAGSNPRWLSRLGAFLARPRLAALALGSRAGRAARLAADRARTRLREVAWSDRARATAAAARRGATRVYGAAGAPRVRLRHAALAATLALLGLLGFLAYAMFTVPLGGGLVVEATPSALVLEADNGQVFATRGVFKGEKLNAGDVPPHLAQAIIAIEDRRFHEHGGIDVRGMVRAAFRNLQAGGTREGGSTITQQLARLMFLSQERTLKRKAQEAMLAIWLEHQLSKEEILVRYLNTAYFGAGAYGVDAAAKRYFGKTAKELSLGEAAMLAGLVRAPSQLAPTRRFDAARERAELVLAAMVETGAISAQDGEAARKQPVTLQLPPETPPGSNYFVDMVAGDVKRLLGNLPSDLTLRTTLDLDLQDIAESVVAKRLESEGAKKKVSQAALVALTPDGAVLALVGGRDYTDSQFNRVTQAKRQPGSLFKLFVYMAAFQQGATPQTVLVDRPTQIGDWEPQNYGGRFRGPVTLRAAFANSINTIAVQLAEDVGIGRVIEVAKRLGVQSELPALPSVALGSGEVTLLEMTRAFAAVAANAQVEPYGVQAIRGREQALYTRSAGVPPLSADLAASRAAMVDVMTAVVREGTGKNARLPQQPSAGKTGTTQENRDAWFIGFTPDLVVGVWVGNDDNTPTNNVTGGDMPAMIWRDFVTRAGGVLAKKRGNQAVAQGAAQPKPTNAAPPQAAGPVRGAAEVVDTGTLDIRGRVVRLVGVEGEDGRFAQQLARFLRRRDVVCEPAANSDRHRCKVEGHDLSALVLLNGGGRATADAPQELLSAEEEARSARLGVWRRWR
jgi:penicillin-binding protein 1A